MTCVNLNCRASIPDDSIFCDQCGQAVLRQGDRSQTERANPSLDRTEHTDQIGLDSASMKEKMVGGGLKSPPAPEAVSKSDAATAFAGRPVQAMDPQVLQLCLSNGSCVELSSGDILGSGEGPLAVAWRDAGLVNDRHGRVESVDGAWSYTDLFSANGSTLNGHFVRPGKPVALQPGDKLVLGNRSCIVL